MIGRLFRTNPRLKSVGWWEPRWSFVPRTLRELQDAFPIAGGLRILLASAIATLALFGIVEFLVRPGLPALQFNWFAAFAQGVGRITVYLAALAALSITIPPRITVSAKGVMRQVGQAVRFVKQEDVRVVHVVLRRGDRHFIRIEKVKGSLRIGLPRKVSLLALEEHFGDRIVVHDHRKAEATACSSVPAWTDR